MNDGKNRRCSGHRGSRRGSPATGKWVYRQKRDSPVTGDRPLDESADVEKPSQSSDVDGIGCTKQPDEVAALKVSRDNKDVLLQSSASSSSNDINLLNQIKDITLSSQDSVSPTSFQKVIVPVDESSGSRGKGGRFTASSLSSRNSPGHVSNGHDSVRGYAKKPSQASDVIGIGCTKQPYKVAASKCSGDNKGLPQSSALSSSNNINLSEAKGMNPVNQKKDVALSSQDSVSPTSGQRVESGDAETSSNKSIMRPFDLFISTNGFKLKPSFKELNSEKKKATKGFEGNVIRPGMVLLKNYLSINDQVMIVNKCRQLGLGEGGFYQPGYSDGALLHLKMMCLGKNWDPETSRYGETRPVDGSTPPKIPVEFTQLVENAIKESQSLVSTKGEDDIPFMQPDICIVNFYTSTGRLGLHQDKDESEKSIRKGLPVVSFSIGDSAEFLFGDQRDEDKAEKLVLESGDVLLFGGKSRSVFHGVRSIKNDTTPKVLGYETSLRPGRLNLTFRQY